MLAVCGSECALHRSLYHRLIRGESHGIDPPGSSFAEDLDMAARSP
jgi:hypothetical protein